MDWAAKTVDREKARQYIKNYRLGSFLNSPMAGENPGIWTPKQWRAAMRTIQEVSAPTLMWTI
jgi:hypothetical protein